ncbi:MAG: hypothetical protein JWM11_8063 [Planctomycetaceae bacterium]|nr:hypothetical protein [Planctomycetaceae bacterium]
MHKLIQYIVQRSQSPLFCRLVVFGFAILVLVWSDCCVTPELSQQTIVAADNPASPVKATIYAPDPSHLWNRLHAALFIRTASDGKIYGEDDIDPILWAPSKFLLAGEHHQRVLKLLDEFLDKDGNTLIQEPLKRAILQHDLWAIFDWTANPDSVFQDEPLLPQRRALQLRLARMIYELALSSDQIRKLPDNYAMAIAAQAFSSKPNLDQPGAPYLPTDLFDPHGSWVLLGEHMQSAAPTHLRFVNGRSAFFVFMQLPEGRQATNDYLKLLTSFPNPVLPHSASDFARLNPDLPQFPVGTHVALARTMLLIDKQGNIVPTKLLEAVQFRVFRDIAKAQESIQEFRLRRHELFSATAGGLHAVGPTDAEFRLFVAHPHDVFENEPADRKPELIMKTCVSCHRTSSQPGILSVHAFTRSFSYDHRPAPLLREYDRGQQEGAAISWKRNQYSWGLLHGLNAVKWDK